MSEVILKGRKTQISFFFPEMKSEGNGNVSPCTPSRIKITLVTLLSFFFKSSLGLTAVEKIVECVRIFM